MNKRLPSFMGNTRGDSRCHIYSQPFGYPIRACDWCIPETDFVDTAKPFCKRCQLIKEGKVQTLLPVD